MRTLRVVLIGALALNLCARHVYANTFETGSNTVAPTLSVTVNVQTAVQLVLSTGTTGPGTPCTVSAGGGGDFSLSFGNVNGLGVGTPSCGGVTATDSSSATYGTNYQLTPSYSGFTATTATLSLTTAGFTQSSTLTLLEGGDTSTMTAIPSSGTSHSISVTVSGTALSRFVGVQVSNANGAGAFPGTAGSSGADSAVITFTMTVP